MHPLVAAPRSSLRCTALGAGPGFRGFSSKTREAHSMSSKFLGVVLFCLCVAAMPPAHAAINSMNLGASFNGAQTSITFRVYSSTATRIEVDLYASGYGANESAVYVLSAQGGGVWQATVPVSS